MKIASVSILISLIALICGLLVIVYMNFETIQNVGSRRATPDFFLRNSFIPLLERFKNHLEETKDFSSVLQHGIREHETVEFFGSTVTRMESIDYGAFRLTYLPGYTLVMESDYNSFLKEGFRFYRVHFMHSISPGSFVSDVFAGSGPVVVLREGGVINQSFIETVERYSIPYLPVRYFLIKD